MKRKAIKIDWDELEAAFNNTNEEIVYYLDRVTGQVALEGEGEDGFDDDDELGDEAVGPEGAIRNDSTRLYIEPPDEDQELTWMEEFVAEDRDLDAGVLGQLRDAVSESDGAAFREVLRAHAEDRDRWFAYRAERLHEAVEAWLDAHEITSVEPPPWRH